MTKETLQKIRCIADYQFAGGAGKVLFPEGVSIKYSRRTGRVKEVLYRRKLLATLRPTTGTFTLTVDGFRRLTRGFKPPRFRVILQEDVADIVKDGCTVFAKHVEDADGEIRAGDDVAVTGKNDEILAVGRAMLNGKEMLSFDRGVAVKVRHGINRQEKKKQP